MSKTLISIVGPTAIGKTALSIKLAQHFKAEIISADSRQFYKEMKIGTAVPSETELNDAKHHFIQHKSIKEHYTVGNFERDAISKLKSLHQIHDKAIMVGGSGLYVKAVEKGLDYFPEVEETIRATLNKRFEKEGLDPLQHQLKLLDPKAFQVIAIDNPKRVIRALEICIGSKQPYSSFLTNSDKTRDFKTFTIGLNAERSVIYDRINKRVDLMIEAGLLEEVKTLIPYRHLNALNTVGYKELFKYFDGDCTIDEARSEIKKNTRRFAKRQLTWFRKDGAIKWFDYRTNVEEIINYINTEN